MEETKKVRGAWRKNELTRIPSELCDRFRWRSPYIPPSLPCDRYTSESIDESGSEHWVNPAPETYVSILFKNAGEPDRKLDNDNGKQCSSATELKERSRSDDWEILGQ